MIPLRKIFPHLVAALACIAFFAVTPFMLYSAWAFSAEDIGGPLNFVIIPFAGALIGLAFSLLIYLPLSLLAERFQFRRWWLIAALLTCALTAVVVLAAVFVAISDGGSTPWAPVLVCTSLALYFVGGFFVYLCCVAVCRRMFP